MGCGASLQRRRALDAKDDERELWALGVTPAFVAEFQARYAPVLDDDASTRDVCAHVVRRATKRLQCSLAEAVARYGWDALDCVTPSGRWVSPSQARDECSTSTRDAMDRPFVAAPTKFVSHAWSAPFAHLAEATLNAARGDGDGDEQASFESSPPPPPTYPRYETPEPDILLWASSASDDAAAPPSSPPPPPCKPPRSNLAFWIDVFAIDQNAASADNAPPDAVEESEWDTSFRSAIAHIGSTVVLLAPCDAPIALTRAWCLFEMHTTLALGGSLDLHIGRDDARRFVDQLNEGQFDLHAVLAAIDVQESGAYHEADRIRILSRVESDVANGGCVGMNRRLSSLVRDWYLRRATTALHALWPLHRHRGALSHNLACLLMDAGIGDAAVALAARCVQALATARADQSGDDPKDQSDDARLAFAAALGTAGRFAASASVAGDVLDGSQNGSETWWRALAATAGALSAQAHASARAAPPAFARNAADDAHVVLEACRVCLAHACLRTRSLLGEADAATWSARHDLANVLAALADVALVRVGTGGSGAAAAAMAAARHARAARDVHQDVLRRRLGALGANHADTQLSRTNCAFAAAVDRAASAAVARETATPKHCVASAA